MSWQPRNHNFGERNSRLAVRHADEWDQKADSGGKAHLKDGIFTGLGTIRKSALCIAMLPKVPALGRLTRPKQYARQTWHEGWENSCWGPCWSYRSEEGCCRSRDRGVHFFGMKAGILIHLRNLSPHFLFEDRVSDRMIKSTPVSMRL